MTEFQPVVPAEKRILEFTPRAILMGIVLGLLFSIGNAYLGLKVGMTVSASIPAAVISMALLRGFGRGVTILEHNMVQTIASSGEGMAAGVIFTVPALVFLGGSPSWSQIFLLSLLGGLLGVLLMIPLRHHLMVEEHATLRYPEGKACAEILKTREGGGYNALLVISGIVVGAIDKLLMGAVQLYSETAEWLVTKRLAITIDSTPSLMGVGFIIGPRYSMIMLAGGAMAWWVLIPLISMFGTGSAAIYPSLVPVGQMNPDDLWTSYIRYIGTGGVAAGGVISLLRLAPLLYKSLHGHMRGMSKALFGAEKKEHVRTDHDLPFLAVICGTILLLGALLILPQLGLNALSVALIIVLAFFFVGITSITVGLIGNSSNPASGMIICTLLATCLVFVALDWTSKLYTLMAMSVGTVVGIAIALAGDTSQDLKTGMLVGATPHKQQFGAMVGVLVPALAMGGILLLLNQAYGLGTPDLPAPQATLMSLVVNGIMEGNLPVALVLVGVMIGVVVELMGIRALPFAIGLYLPMGTTLMIGVGGILAYLTRLISKDASTKQRGVLIGSGLIAGDALTGVLIALLAVTGIISTEPNPILSKWATLLSVIVVFGYFGWFTLRRPKGVSS